MEQLYTFAQIAKELGITVGELIEIAIEEELIDESGKPTQKAIDNGFLIEGNIDLN